MLLFWLAGLSLQSNVTAIALSALTLLAAVGAAVYIYQLAPGHERDAGCYEAPDYTGIGGWLILVMIGTASRVYYYGQTLSGAFDLMGHQAKWNNLTLPGRRLYDPLWYPSLVFESAGTLVLLTAVALSFVLLFKRKFTYPAVMIGIFAGSFAFHLVDHLLARQIQAIKHNDAAFALLVFRMTVSSAIWIPYFLVSKRVKATFTR